MNRKLCFTDAIVWFLLVVFVFTIELIPAYCNARKDYVVKTTIHKEADKVWLEGVNCWSVGDKESSVHAAQEAVMQAAGVDINYAYLLGVSSLAFRMQVDKTGFCPSSPHSYCGYECVERSESALPWRIVHYSVKPEDASRVSEARRAIVESIDRGIPVQYGCEEDGLIIGYQKDGAEWICIHTYRDGGKKSFIETQWPWGISVYSGPKENMAIKRELAVGALKQALTMMDTAEADGYYVGFKAWDKYITGLKALDKADDKTRAGAMQGNAWIYECLAQYRSCGAVYLKEIAGEFDSDIAKHLRKAAELYDKMANSVLRDKEHNVITIAPYPWMLKNGESWTSDMRKEQVRRLKDALKLEKQAIGQVREAVELIDRS